MLIATQSGVAGPLHGRAVADRRAQEGTADLRLSVPVRYRRRSRAVLDGPVGRKMLDSLSDMNLQGLVWAGGAFRNMSNSKRPLNAHGRHEGPEGARDAEPDGTGEFQRDGHERGADGFHRGLPGARDQGARRLRASGGRHVREQDVRGAEVPDDHQPRLYAGRAGGIEEVVVQPDARAAVGGAEGGRG